MAKDEAVSMSREELERTMRTLEPLYDLVRVVNPSLTEGRTLGEDGSLGSTHRCFALLAKGRRCTNCISARTIACRHPVSKFEFVGDDTFYISTRLVEVEGTPLTIELVKRINDDMLVSSGDQGTAEQMRTILESDADLKYLDPETQAYTASYLADGVAALKGDKIALVGVFGPQDTEVPRLAVGARSVAEAVVRAIRGNIRQVDTIVRLDDLTFAVVFEGLPHHLYQTRLRQIRNDVAKALEELGLPPATDVAIGAIEREGTIDDLLRLVRGALERARKATQRIVVVADVGPSAKDSDGSKAVPERLPARRLSSHAVDSLTGLPLAHVFRTSLQARIDALGAKDEALFVVYLDIENFKSFNRSFGLPEGDLLLVRLADAIRLQFPDDLVTRTGVDTFAIATTRPDVEVRLAHLRRLVASLRRDVALELKAGLAEVGDSEFVATTAMDRAKIACDSIKGKHDLTARTFDGELEHAMQVQETILGSLDAAIERGYIQPYYQPIVRSFSGNVCAMEALSRWHDPTYGILSPADVIPTLESRHLIHLHDLHMVRCVCRDLRAKLDAGSQVVPVSVNLSRLDFELCDIFDEVEGIVGAYGIARSLLDIEVTESTLHSSSSFAPQVERFRAAGYEIWMDDFGSGYSSLNLLKDYDFDVLKIDMAFLAGLEDNPNARKIITSIVDMAKRLGIRTLAEGVETASQLRFLQSIGCEMIQGFLFARPLAFEHIDAAERMGLEREGDRAYFESVGRVNLLSQQPAEAIAMRASKEVVRGMPLAIVEWDGARFHFFTSNDAYLRYLWTLGFQTVEEAERALNGNEGLVRRFAAFVEQIGEDASERLVTYELEKTQHAATVQFVARCDRATAFLMHPQLYVA